MINQDQGGACAEWRGGCGNRKRGLASLLFPFINTFFPQKNYHVESVVFLSLFCKEPDRVLGAC